MIYKDNIKKKIKKMTILLIQFSKIILAKILKYYKKNQLSKTNKI